MRRVAGILLFLIAGCGLDESGLLAPGEEAGAPDVSIPDVATPDVVADDAPITEDASVADAAEDATLDAGVDAPYDAGPILTITGGTYTLLDADAGLCSQNSNTAASFTITNDRDAAVDLLWVDFGCTEQPYGTITPGGNASHSTYVTHVWRIRDDASKSFLASVVLQSANAFAITVH